MADIKKVLVATDLSDMSLSALEHARMVADKEGAELHVQYVHLEPVQIYGVSGMAIPEAPSVEAIENIQTRIAEWCSDDKAIIADFERDYSVPMAINRYAEDKDIDLVVLGTHARKGASRFFLGSVASEVIRTSSIPVLVVGPEQSVREQGYGKIMVAIDFSAASLLAFHQAMQFARDFGASLLAVHVVDIGNLPPHFPDEYTKVAQAQATQAMEDLLAPVKKDIEVEQVVTIGDPHRILAEITSGSVTDLVVMGTAGLRGLKGLLTGSVADRVVRSASCPVMVVHNPKDDE